MIRYIPIGWTNQELIDQLAYERSKSPLIDQLCRRFAAYLEACDIEMLTLKLEAKYKSRLQEIDACISSASDCPICGAQLGLHIELDADSPLSLIPYVQPKKTESEESK